VLFHLKDITELRQKPFVNVGHMMYFFDAITTMKCSRDREDALIRWIDQLLVDVLNVLVLGYFQAQTRAVLDTVTYLGEPRKLIVNRSNGFLNCFLKCPSNAHDFTDALHTTTQKPADTTELLEVPAWNLDDTVVQAGLKTSTSHFGY